ncbi:MAG TPA: hypothetical protein PKC76_06325 [Saprospiraceae bacterium]|nr:hypothetical protein [Saprospiraceae bacterium]HMP23727.1 hypothetical protein [Saprospiraceae bacterium]
MEKNKDHIIGGYVRGNISAEDRAWLEQAMQEDAALAAEVQTLQLDYTIECYLAGKMEAPEKAVFENRLATDADLQAKVQEEKIAQQFLQSVRRLRLREDLDKAAQRSRERRAKRRQVFRWSLVAVLVLLIGGGTLWWQQPRPPEEPTDPIENEDQPIVKTNTPPSDTAQQRRNATLPKPQKDSPRTSGKDSLIIALLDDADRRRLQLPATRGSNDAPSQPWFDAYSAGNYPQVIALLGPQIDQVLSDNDTARLALGLAWYYQQPPDYAQAIVQFDALLNSSSAFFTQRARWFKASALLRQGQTSEALPLLQLIATQEGATYQKGTAQALLRLLSAN